MSEDTHRQAPGETQATRDSGPTPAATVGTVGTLATQDSGPTPTGTLATVGTLETLGLHPGGLHPGTEGDPSGDSGPRPTRAAPAQLRAGDRLGRFLILRKLGEGGMGVVFVGYDDQLDRRVALKLLRTRYDDRRALARLTREAQGLARLSHPNVVQVHEVGVFEGSMFIAMELVVGETLGAWLGGGDEDHGRRLPEIVGVLIQAGRGLQAAHAAKLVHRDFKPDNMMVASDGRVRVLDFGLVRGDTNDELDHDHDHDHDTSDDTSDDRPPPNPNLARPLTLAGSLLGTPAYMAPEQIQGKPADALADQFSFCVVAYESLYGQRPFAGDTLAELAKNIDAGRIRPRPTRVQVQRQVQRRIPRRIPSRIHAAIVRGLAADPRQRWPDMASLLAELEGSLATRRGWMWAGLGLVGATALGLVLALASQLQTTEIDLAAANAKLAIELEQSRARQAELAEGLAIQRALRARSLIDDDREGEALMLALLALGPREHEADAPLEAREALAQILADDVRVIRPEATLDAHSATLWDAVQAPEGAPQGAEIATASQEGAIQLWAPSDSPNNPMRIRATLEGHAGVVRALRYRPSGELVSVGDDGTLRIWDPSQASELAQLTAPPDPATTRIALVGLELDPTGNVAITATSAGAVHIWDLDSAQLVVHTPPGNPRVDAFAFSPDGARVVVGGPVRPVHGWRLYDSGAAPTAPVAPVVEAIYTGLGPALALAFSPDGRRLASVSSDGARMLEFETGAIEAPFGRAGLRLNALAFAPDSSQLVVGGEDRLVRATNFDAVDPPPMRGHRGWVTALRYTPDGTRILSASPDGSARLWDARSAKPLATLRGHEGEIHSLRVSADGRHALSAGEDGTARIWSLEIDTFVVALEGHRDAINGLSWSPEGDRIASASDDGLAMVWETTRGEPITKLRAHTSEVLGVAFDPRPRAAGASPRLLTIGADATTRMWDPEGGQQLGVHEGRDAVLAVAWSPDGNYWATAGLDRTLTIFDATTGMVVGSLPSITGLVTDLAWSPDGQRLATAWSDGRVRLFGTQAGQISNLHLDDASRCAIWMAWSPDSQRLATGSCNNVVTVWDPSTGEPLTTLTGHRNSITALAFSPDGRELASASADGSVRVWDPARGTELAALPATTTALNHLSFSPDGAHLAAGGRDGKVWIWTCSDHALASTLDAHRGPITALAFSPAGDRLALASEDQRASIWSVADGRLEFILEDRIGLRQPDGRVEWPAPLDRLRTIGCERIRAFPEYEATPALAEVCDTEP